MSGNKRKLRVRQILVVVNMKSFIQKYGVRANVLGKMDRKLTLAGTAIDIKIADFDATITMLRKEYEFAKNAKAATESAKSAMMFTKDWELEYALDVVTSTRDLGENILAISNSFGFGGHNAVIAVRSYNK